MGDDKISIIPYDEALRITYDAKIVSLRWDLVPWSLVLDIDYKSAFEQTNSEIGRAWLVFYDITELWFSFDEARLPNGLFSTYYISTSKIDAEYTDYSLSILAPTFDATNKISLDPHKTLKIRAKKLRSAKSIIVGAFGEFGPTFTQRQALGNDQEFLCVFEK